MDLCLHYAPDNASLCIRLALERLGLGYRTALVDRAARGQKAESYLKLNPNGLIPVLETPDGVLFETGAILLWLDEARPGVLMPEQGTPARAEALTWLVWLANTLHPAMRMLFYPDQYLPDDPDALRAATRARLVRLYALAEARLPDTALDPELSALGCYLGPMLRWSALYGGTTDWFELARWPRLDAFARAAETAPEVRRVAEAEGLGPTPFSQPVWPNPPEGSAL